MKLRPLVVMAWAAVLAVTAVLLVVLFAFDPARHDFYPVCYWRSWTGLNCAGCGSLRATHHFLHGELATAFRYNPLLVLVTPLLAVGLAWRCWKLLRPTSIPPRLDERPRLGWIWIGVVVLVAYTILRNIPLPALAWLAPP